MINKDGTYRWSSNNAKGNFGKIGKIIVIAAIAAALIIAGNTCIWTFSLPSVRMSSTEVEPTKLRTWL